MTQSRHPARPAVTAALTAAVLFGVSTPLAKVLVREVSPWMLAGLLYLGSGLALGLWRLVRRLPWTPPTRRELPSLIGAVTFGGIAAPVLLMAGLAGMPATGASLLLNAEAVLTVAIAWLAFGEHVNRRTLAGFACILAGVVVLGWQDHLQFGGLWPTLALLGACLGWAVDNNLTRGVSSVDAGWLAMIKGLVTGPANLAIAATLGSSVPVATTVVPALALGAVSYGMSLVLFIVGLRGLGTARAGAYFSTAPFFGGLVAIALGDPLTVPVALAGLLMGFGVWLHLSEHHSHVHTHALLTHDHWHTHDEHHQHAHEEAVAPGVRHRHPHVHEPVTHEHPHYPDIHHRHPH